ncbi:MAG TPA: hypothetical protein VGF45_20160 [Polyangia bacterium]
MTAPRTTAVTATNRQWWESVALGDGDVVVMVIATLHIESYQGASDRGWFARLAPETILFRDARGGRVCFAVTGEAVPEPPLPALQRNGRSG